MTDRPDELDDFLGAPDQVACSERERTKLAERKARNAARQERERLSKSQDAPTQEDILADLVRVAEDPDVNPFHEFRALSQRRYELFGHYPIEAVQRLCGQFAHAKQQASLDMQVGTRLKLRARTEESLREHDARYMRKYLLPHVDKFPELRRATAGTHCGVVISDTHSLYLDPFTWHVFLDVVSDLEPDVVHFNGDVIDGSEISRFPKVPGGTKSLQLELDFAREMFRQVRERVPASTRILWGAGNHFLDRMTRYFTQVAPELAGLRNLRLDKLVDLGDLEIELVQGGSFMSPVGTEDDVPRRRLWDAYLVTHGTRLGRYPAAAEMAQWGCSGTSGHVHRASVHFGATFTDRGMSWMVTPMGCHETAGRHYIKDFAGWQKGFGVFFVHGKAVRHYPVLTDDGVAVIEGRTYVAADDLPDADPTRMWLEGMA